MDMIFPATEAQQLYKQWQDGKLLDVEERKALRPGTQNDVPNVSFADLLKGSGELEG
jgi:hypothetical protein